MTSDRAVGHFGALSLPLYEVNAMPLVQPSSSHPLPRRPPPSRSSAKQSLISGFFTKAASPSLSPSSSSSSVTSLETSSFDFSLTPSSTPIDYLTPPSAPLRPFSPSSPPSPSSSTVESAPRPSRNEVTRREAVDVVNRSRNREDDSPVERKRAQLRVRKRIKEEEEEEEETELFRESLIEHVRTSSRYFPSPQPIEPSADSTYLNSMTIDEEGDVDENLPLLRKSVLNGNDVSSPQPLRKRLKHASHICNTPLRSGLQQMNTSQEALEVLSSFSPHSALTPLSLPTPLNPSATKSAGSKSRSKNSSGKTDKVIQQALVLDLGDELESESAEIDDNNISPLSSASTTTSTKTTLKESTHPWLHEDKIRDAKGVGKGHPNYDPSTLFIDEKYYKDMTPAVAQYWQFKAQNFDTILLFKVGQFYEVMDEPDAHICARECGLSYMQNKERPHVGFPESAYERYAKILIERGYKVGRVEQTQTPKELAAANKQRAKGAKAQKVVERSLCAVLTPATLTDPNMIDSSNARYLLALRERELNVEEASKIPSLPLGGMACVEFGICFVDPSTGKIHLGQFYDDLTRSHLSTLLGWLAPEEVIMLSHNLSQSTMLVLRTELPANVFKSIWKLPSTSFYDAATTYELIKSRKYFVSSSTSSSCHDEDGEDVNDGEMDCMKGEEHEDAQESWPPALMVLLERGEQAELAFSALGGVLYVLHKTMIDRQILTQRHFEIWTPGQGFAHCSNHLVLDHKALVNLEIFNDSEDGTAGSLLAYVDHCVSPSGHRLMRKWLAQPLGSIKDINDRLNAVEFLMQNSHLCEQITSLLSKLPDLERHVSILNAYALKKAKKEVLYGTQENKKLSLFHKVLQAFECAANIRHSLFNSIEPGSITSHCLIRCTLNFPDYLELLSEFQQVDFTTAINDGCIKPRQGDDADYDQACLEEDSCLRHLQEYLMSMRKQMKDPSLSYKSVNKDRYCLEFPKSRKLSPEFKIVTSTKSCQRVHTDELSKTLIPALEDAELAKETIEKDATRRLYERFLKHQNVWQKAVSCLAELDCLCSLARVSRDQIALCGHSTRPQFVEFEHAKGGQGKSLLEFRDSVHPVLVKSGAAAASGSFIDNNIVLGCGENLARFTIVSGPNAGGKSTLLRQTCCLVILTHLGCFVPASFARLTPVDRIFTRLGAGDAIMQGASTFMMELTETATIVRHATPRSLLILDELGRGTSTFDGTAIAWAVVRWLLQDSIDCLTLFSTHYHRLMYEFQNEERVSFWHMSCAEPDNKESRDIVFLYKFVYGSCPKSHGLYVAKLARLPGIVVQQAAEQSDAFERRLAERKLRRVPRDELCTLLKNFALT